MATASEGDGDQLRSQDLPFGVILIPKNVVWRVATVNNAIGRCSRRRLDSADYNRARISAFFRANSVSVSTPASRSEASWRSCSIGSGAV